jgi:hypothetical protein
MVFVSDANAQLNALRIKTTVPSSLPIVQVPAAAETSECHDGEALIAGQDKESGCESRHVPTRTN